MKKILITPVLFFLSAMAFSQASQVVLSELKATPLIDASAPEQNGFFIELKISDPSALTSLETAVQDDKFGSAATRLLPLQHKDGKTALVYDSYTIPFEGQYLRFLLKVSDQMKSPYHKIVITGTDKAGRTTNAVVFDQFN